MILTAGGSGELLTSLLLFGRRAKQVHHDCGPRLVPIANADPGLQTTVTIFDVSDKGMRGVVNVLPEAKFGVVNVQPEVLKLALIHHPALYRVIDRHSWKLRLV